MADTDKKVTDTDKKAPDTDKKEAAKTEKSEKPQQAAAKVGILTWIIMAAVVVLLAGSGYMIGRLFAGSPSSEEAPSSQENAPAEKHKAEKSKAEKPKKEGAKEEKSKKEETKAGKKAPTGSGETKDTWYYNELESVVVNPDEPGATRFIRIGVTLEISNALSSEEAKAIVDEQKPALINWLNLYFKSLTLGEMQNDKDMKRILSQICDSFNEILFPNAKPQIKKILIREFNIQ